MPDITIIEDELTFTRSKIQNAITNAQTVVRLMDARGLDSAYAAQLVDDLRGAEQQTQWVFEELLRANDTEAPADE